MRFAQQMVPDVMAASDSPAVAALAALAERQPVFLATPMAG
ncbi:hypothetical protein [Janthinobacterium sp. P210005]|nr:hypothetical protein [Janthinobacterium sp. P210005]